MSREREIYVIQVFTYRINSGSRMELIVVSILQYVNATPQSIAAIESDKIYKNYIENFPVLIYSSER